MSKYTGTNQGKYAFHFLKSEHALRDNTLAPADGVWLEHAGPVTICSSGLHASWRVCDALSFAPGPWLCLVEVDHIIGQQNDKLVCRRRKIIARFDATELLRADARASALSCLKYWNGVPPQAVTDWLTTGDEKYRSAAGRAAETARGAARSAARGAAESAAWSAAESAAWIAAESAAWSAAWSAAESAAWSAAESAARGAAWSAAESAATSRLHDSVMTKFVSMGVLHE